MAGTENKTSEPFASTLTGLAKLTPTNVDELFTEVVAEWQRERAHQAVTEGPAIGIHPLRYSLTILPIPF